MMVQAPEVNAAELAHAVVALVRAFGLHRPEETPCGQPIAVAEAHALMDLADAGPLIQGELASRLRLEKSTVSRLVRQMEGRGWLERGAAAHDGRAVSLWLTPAGESAAARLAAARERKFAGILEALSAEQRPTVVTAVAALAKAATGA